MNPVQVQNMKPMISSPLHHLPPFCPLKNSLAIRSSNGNPTHGSCKSFKRVFGSHIVWKSKCKLVRCEGSGGSIDDGFYMRKCVEVARKAVGCTSPNPMVGCVIVKSGQIVGQGFHPKAGQPHAEVFALNDAGNLAKDATAYVSLEPCNHYGRTPPCTEALIRARVKRVVVGMVDPNPIVASKGVERLRETGIDVTVGVEEKLCQKLNEAYIHKMLTGNPFVTLRYSLGFNGGILDSLDDGAESSGGYYSQLLQEYDAVVISSNSLLKNSTFPTSHEPGAKQPFLIIVAETWSSLVSLPALPPQVASRSIVFAASDVIENPNTKPNVLQQGTELVVFDQVSLYPILEYCTRMGMCSVFLDLRGDCGALYELVEVGMENGLLQKVVMEVCSVWGGRKESLALDAQRKYFRLENLQSRVLKESVVVEGYMR
ncbi:hypothetical protein QJS10_CPA06g00311 [Acorus calamus]|uniref:Riboflavin biosynthesis protein PYRD, chloroplastic n=1 Tax=Acorus calamus TaxID=4465 RepID=A0AAV9EJ02_ACOCL|nr:hypothetical protein QJS10_CPA06g00311 [Acorus calamus]